jgi:hypothetical protein
MSHPAGDHGAPGRPTYLLPLRWEAGRNADELTAYLRRIAETCEVVVVDGSPDPVFRSHHHSWRQSSCHICPDSSLTCRNGKVNAVMTGMRMASGDRVVIADDDVRYDDQQLANVLMLLGSADIVIPQNYFSPLPWHAAWDSARSLINRAFGMDYPGTVAVRRSAFMELGCYDGDVLFENLELIRTLVAGGAQLASAPQIFVRRLPPDFHQFARQRIRQAYDSLAQPLRLAAELTLLPAGVIAAVNRRYTVLGAAAAAAVVLAELGRRRHGGTAAFSWVVPLLAPAWIAERSVCSWLAVACRLRGGITYAGHRISRAATPAKVLRRRARLLSAAGSAEAGSRM